MGGGADGDKIRRQLVPQHGRRVHYHVLQGGKLHPGGGALVWKENDLRFEVELVLFCSSNTLTFQLRMGDEQHNIVGTYIPPNCTRRVEDIRQAAEACPAGWKLLVMGDLNIKVGFPHEEREEVLVNLLDELCLVDSPCGYQLWTPCKTATRGSQKQGTTQHYLQLNYILGHAEERAMFTGVGFCYLRFLHSDHCAIVAVVRAGGGGSSEEVPAPVPETSAIPATGANRCRHNGVRHTSSQVH
jgi:hypothetical protein